MTTPHPQAEILRAIADGEQIQLKERGLWKDIDHGEALARLSWPSARQEIRTKPKTIRIGDFDVPESIREAPEEGITYYVADATLSDYFDKYTWKNTSLDKSWLTRGLCHATKEAAVLHAKALLSFTEKKE